MGQNLGQEQGQLAAEEQEEINRYIYSERAREEEEKAAYRKGDFGYL